MTLSLMSAAVAFTTKALGVWLGAAGISLAVLSLTTVGNAVSGATIGYDILPSWAQAISPVLPPGAAFRAVSDFGYFNGSTAWSSLMVLAIWAAAGLGLVFLRSATRARRTRSIQARAETAAVAAA